MASKNLYGGIEGGGTKFVCVIGDSPDNLIAETRIATTTPEETLSQVVAFFQQDTGDRLAAVGIACFGPMDLDPGSDTFGFITRTTKPGWSYTDLLTPLRTALDVPVTVDTDVNGAAMGEHLWGAAKGVDTFFYLTVGTGIGGGGMVNGRLMHGLTHPEMGHIRIPHDWQQDPFEGVCPFHGDCLEGLASGPAIAARWGTPAENLAQEHPAWQLEAHYLGVALANYILVASPQRIVMGGGVMQAPWLIGLLRGEVRRSLSNYISHPTLDAGIDSYIVSAALGQRTGVLGAMGMALTNSD